MDPLNLICIAALHHVFLPRINKKLELWMTAWANHKMCTTRTSPLHLWLSSQILLAFPKQPPKKDKVANYVIEGKDTEVNERPISNPPHNRVE